MKKIKYIILFLFVIFTCVGCEGDITREIRHDGFALSGNEFVCNELLSGEEKVTTNVKYLGNGYVISNSGKIYEISLGQVYSNDSNCKKADTNIEVVSVFDGAIVKSVDNKYYYLTASNNVSSYSEVTVNDNSYNIYNLLLSEQDVIKVQTVNQSTGSYYVLKEDGNVYNYVVTRVNYNSPYTIVSKDVIYNKDDFGGEIIDFYEASNSLATFVKTKSEIYKMQITNEEECSKYADVSCKYKLKKDKTLTKHYDYIMAYNGSTLITTYGKTFGVNK